MLRIAFIGLGGRGVGLMRGVVFKMKDVQVVGVCDSYDDRAEDAKKLVERHYGSCELCTTDYKKILEMKLDAVIIATSWEDHVKIAVDAMEKGIYVGMEVGGAYNVDDCWKLVDTYERTGIPCMMLENCCYGRYELMVLDMVRKGLFGEIVHCAGGYKHDLRGEISGGNENRHYRLRNYIARNCENYPTHELGPIAKILDINRGNVMTSLYSVSSNARGLHEYIIKKKGNQSELANTEFAQGDVVTTLIKCAGGETIQLTLDTTLPRYYSRGFTVRGTKAFYEEEGNVLFIDGKDNIKDFFPKLLWNSAKRRVKYRKNNHPIWREFLRRGVQGGHGGMDWLVFRAFFDSVIAHNGLVPIDVYDTASWMVITPLSEISVRENRSVEIPDFTRGKWKNREDKGEGLYFLE